MASPVSVKAPSCLPPNSRGCWCGGTGNLEHRHIAGHAAPSHNLFCRGACHVISDGQHANVDPFAPQPLGRRAEVEHIAGIVPEAQQNAAATMGAKGDIMHQPGRWRCEDIAGDGAIGEAGPDIAGEGRVVTAAAADDDGNLIWSRGCGAQDAARRRAHKPRMDGAEALKGLLRESLGRVDKMSHDDLNLLAGAPSRALRAVVVTASA
jgi:hypothetical protein